MYRHLRFVFLFSLTILCLQSIGMQPYGNISGRLLDNKSEQKKTEFRAVWVATINNIDWPSSPNLPVEEQKREFLKLLDSFQKFNLNVVILQVRAASDAFYKSKTEPWSIFLTGKQGRPPFPFYDPLAWAIEMCHQRGIELHAWFNPFRARHPSAPPAPLRRQSPGATFPTVRPLSSGQYPKWQFCAFDLLMKWFRPTT